MKLLRTPRLAVTALLLTVIVAACGGDSGTGPNATPPGDYVLSSVNAKPLPYRVASDTLYTVDITKSGLALKSDGTFSATMQIEERVQSHLSVYADTATGKWVLAGSTVTFTGSDSSKTTGSFAGSSITLIDSTGVAPLTYVYTKK